MVRRDEALRGAARAVTSAASRCASSAGVSPVPVGAEAPGSRPQVSREISCIQAGYRKPVKRRMPRSGKQARGPQHEVKPAASTEKQSESRAAHFTAKATSGALVSERASDLGGVGGAARVQGEAWNTRGPSASLQSQQSSSYKPVAKSSAVQRESEGLVVPMMVVQNNATGGKGLCFGHARREGKREGMAGKTGPNDPGARTCDVKVQQPRSELWVRTKRTGRPFVQVTPGRPSASRVREIRTHGLKGGPALSPMTNIE